MSTSLKFLILLSFFSVAFGYYNVRDNAQWFKDRERITDRFLVGMIKGRNALCNGTVGSEKSEGVCLPAKECNRLGGKRGGGCSFLGTCCIIEHSCSDTATSKLSYFVSPQNPLSTCSLTVKPRNQDVCQIRLDFETFSIEQPTADSIDSSYQCRNDEFTVTSTATNLGFSHLCGENAGQHIYIPVSNQNKVVLTFNINTKLDSTRKWKIKIRQLECTRSYFADNNVHSGLAAMHLTSNHRPAQGFDYDLIAPVGCLQYYTKPNGEYKTFNFNPKSTTKNGPYIGMMSYAICFKRPLDVCGISHEGKDFWMNSDNPQEDGVDSNCNPNTEGSDVSRDYLYIPGGRIENKYHDYYCNKKLEMKTVISAVSGPLSVRVNTDSRRPNFGIESGFQIMYKLLPTGSCKTN